MKPRRKGRVYLIGAGPGDPYLITLRGKEILEKADAIVYDSLVSLELLQFAPRAKKVFAGKSPGGRPSRQLEINRLLVSLARQGKEVARLKGGDPFIFGRGGEEAAYLKEHGVAFEVVPGITAGVAAGAYSGIPLTDRALASQVVFLTAHEDPHKSNSAIDWDILPKLRGTLVFYMGAKNLNEVVARLLEKGASKSTPVALVEWATTRNQRVLTGDLSNIIKKAKEAGLRPPAVAIVGDVVRHRRNLVWFQKKPLLGKKVLITRARHQAMVLRRQLEELGAEVAEFPTIEILPPLSFQSIDREIERLGSYDWIVFTSANGVNRFFERVRALAKDARIFAGLKIAVIGSATREELLEKGLRADLVPKEFSTEALFHALRRREPLRGKRILLARVHEANPRLKADLLREGARVTEIDVYRTSPVPVNGHPTLSEIREGKIDIVTFTSSSTVKNFVDLLGKKALLRMKSLPQVVTIGPVTTNTARSLGLSVSHQALKYTIPGLVKAVIKAASST